MINSLFIRGNLGHDPKVNETSNGNKVCTVELFCNYTESGSNLEKVVKVRVVSWNKLAELVGELKQNDLIIVKGHLQNQKFTPKGNEKAVTSLEIKAERIEVIKINK